MGPGDALGFMTGDTHGNMTGDMTGDMTGEKKTWMRVAVGALIAHGALSAFSAFAFSTFLIPPYPDWLQTPTNQIVLANGYRYGGQTTVLLGAIAGFAVLVWGVGTRKAMVVFLAAFVLSLGAELAGTSTGLPFGAYGYTDMLGYKIGGLVPFNIPTSWFYMLVASLAICGRMLPVRDDALSKWWWALVAALVLTAWDVSMDPAMVKTTHWLWFVPDLSTASPVARFIGTPFFYGMPLTNWLGWLLTGTLVARAMLVVVPPSLWAATLSRSTVPLVLYGVNGILPIAICFAQDMPIAGALGLVAMAVPLALSVIGKRQDACA